MNCCFTGHRTHKLNGSLPVIQSKLKDVIRELVCTGVTEFYTGMAQGIDLMAASVVIGLKDKDPRIQLAAAIPFKGQEKGWSQWDKELYNHVLSACDKTFVLSQDYYSRCYFDRNEFMVDRCDVVLAVFNGSSGGTKHTIDYARQRGKEIIIIDPSSDYSSMRQITL